MSHSFAPQKLLQNTAYGPQVIYGAIPFAGAFFRRHVDRVVCLAWTTTEPFGMHTPSPSPTFSGGPVRRVEDCAASDHGVACDIHDACGTGPAPAPTTTAGLEANLSLQHL